METFLAHIVLNVDPTNLLFYKELMAFLGWQTIHGDDTMLGVAGPHDISLWFMGQVKEVSNDYDGPGVNHIAIGVPAAGDVDGAAEYLIERGVELLFETPRHRPEFSESDAHTYYQIMFETPDRILIEIVYTGPKAD